ncbi:MAG: glycerol acyltransferase [Bacteroidetes bacterium]|nr:glycerol acyltransferase [Bacteroidota bacterium]
MQVVENGSPDITQKLIDVEKVIAGKNPRILKFIPRFLITLLARIIHQDYINDFIYRNRDISGLPYVDQILKEFGLRYQVTGIENIPREGRFLVAANHPLGGLDGLALLHAVGAIRPDVTFPVNDLLTYIPGLKPLFIPVNKHGSNAENIRIIEETFASGKTILYFPSGMVSRKQKGKIYDTVWIKTFLSKSRKFQRDIVPTYIDGRNSNFFYRLANFRTAIGLKVNLEMLFLPDEMLKQRHKTVGITFGKPIPYQVFDASRKDDQWAELIRRYTYSLKDDPEAIFDPSKPLIQG